MKYRVAVVGGGHAGIEASCCVARMGIDVVLITAAIDAIGQMSCNPAIGGIAKGTIVREIDALGGVMGKAIDYAGIHFKMLNKTKGMAVWGPRAQADKRKYRFYLRRELEKYHQVMLYQGMVTGIACKGRRVAALKLDCGESIACDAAILCPGTFLNGIAHIGAESFPCGRAGEPPSLYLTESLVEHGLHPGRLKTGTPPRIDGRSVDCAKLQEQRGDDEPWHFSYEKECTLSNTISCWIGKTTPLTHRIIRQNLSQSPLFSGKIVGIGPRYCPSIEDKVVRFGEREGHTLFLEPEGDDICEMYLNGLSTSLPLTVQQEMVHSVEGLEQARITRPGYAIEYDYFNPIQLMPTLETKAIGGLFFAGQINGTSGYEEAACQGLIAAINAVAHLRGEQPLVLGRESSYIGVLIDDLVTKGTSEPYRMFTSRAEYRLLLRQDNADERLYAYAQERGLLSEKKRIVYHERMRRKHAVVKKLKEGTITPAQWEQLQKLQPLNRPAKGYELLKRSDVSFQEIGLCIGIPEIERELALGIRADSHYSGFVDKQKRDIERYAHLQNMAIHAGVDYDAIQGFLLETRTKLKEVCPQTVGQAGRIPGITPADISVLIRYLVRRNNGDVSRETAG